MWSASCTKGEYLRAHLLLGHQRHRLQAQRRWGVHSVEGLRRSFPVAMAAPASPATPKDDDVATEKQWLLGTYLPSLLPNIKSAILEAQEILSFPAHSVKLVSLKSVEYAIILGDER